MPDNPITILLADDDLEDLELIETAISSLQPKAILHTVTTGKAVIQYLSNQPDGELPCIIILDYNMPELTGSQVLSIICGQKRYDHIPKIVLSTSNAPHYLQECLNNGATEYLVKPNNMAGLIRLAEKMLDYCGR
ncbi:MAG TPA: response regulator [Chitinophagaceae bacterium]|nr:response regulator [Chitinophagaceae bacterium]